MIKTDKNLNISADSQLIFTKLSKQGSFFQGSQNESKESCAMIKTDKNVKISADSQQICAGLSKQGSFFKVVKMSPKKYLCYDQNWTKS